MIKCTYFDHSLSIEVPNEMNLIIDQFREDVFGGGVQLNSIDPKWESLLMKEGQIIYNALSNISAYLLLISQETK